MSMHQFVKLFCLNYQAYSPTLLVGKLSYYFIDFVLADFLNEQVTLASVFSASNNLMNDDLKSFLFSIVISVLFLILIGILTEKKIKKEYLS